MLRKLTPKKILFITFGLLLVLLISLDLISAYQNGLQSDIAAYYFSSELWNVMFFAEYLALFITTIFVVSLPRFRSSFIKWFLASITMLCLIFFGLWQFYYGPRIVTEVDGVSDVRYACVISDFYDTFDSLPSEELVCALHSIPTPTTNLIDIATSGKLQAASDFTKFISFMLYNSVFVGSILVIKRFPKNP